MKKTIIVQIIIFSVLPFVGQGQSERIDSLRKALREDAVKEYKVVWQLAYDLFDVDNPQALFYARRAHHLATEMGDTIEFVKSGRIMGQLLWRVDKIDEAIKLLPGLIDIAGRNGLMEEKGKMQNALGAAYTYAAKYDRALEINFELLGIRRDLKDSIGLSVTTNNIGHLYSYLGFHDLALKYFFQSLSLRDRIGYEADKDVVLVNVGDNYNSLGDYDSALYFFRKVKALDSEVISNKALVICEFGMGTSYLNQNNLTKAREHAKEALRLSHVVGNQQRKLSSLLLLAKIDLARGDFQNYRLGIRRIADLPDRNQYPYEMLQYYEALSELLVSLGDMNSAAEAQSKYIQLQKIVGSTTITRNVMQAQAKFVERENFEKLENQTKVLALQKEMIKHNVLVNLMLVLITILCIGIALFVWRTASQRKRINQLLDLKVKERTRELEINRNELWRMNQEKGELIETIYSQIHSFLATQNGLCRLAKMELPPNQAQYFDQARNEAEKLSSQISIIRNRNTSHSVG